MAKPTRWVTETGPDHSAWYIDRFRTMAAEGADLAGEARLVDALVARGSRLLDAGCGPGRVAGELHARGHRVVGVDADPALIEAAEEDHPGPRYLVADLSELDLATMGEPEPFDAAVIAGNVFWFVAADTEADVVAHVASHLRPDAVLVAGWGTSKGYAVEAFEAHCRAAGLVVEHRFATWDLRPWTPESDFAVVVSRKP
jgi:SAM-dependent methyltransferase